MTHKAKRIIVAIALVVPIALLLRTGLYFLIAPVEGAAGAGMRLEAPAAISHIRVSLGGFHLAMATIMAVGLFFRTLRFPALLFMSLFMTIVLAARAFGILLDGYDPLEFLPVMGESITFSAMLIGCTLERRILRAEQSILDKAFRN